MKSPYHVIKEYDTHGSDVGVFLTTAGVCVATQTSRLRAGAKVPKAPPRGAHADEVERYHNELAGLYEHIQCSKGVMREFHGLSFLAAVDLLLSLHKEGYVISDALLDTLENEADKQGLA